MTERHFGAKYYQSQCGIPYSRDEPHWSRFFGDIATRIDATLAPRRVFDAGCAIGSLVEALRARGIEAFGRDLSSYEIEQVPLGLKPYCECGSIADPIDGCYDLVTCIEVLEHMPPDEANLAVRNLCSVAPLVLFSSSPTDFAETTHVNVQPPIYWMQLFAGEGFGPRLGHDAGYLCPWAILFERRESAPTQTELDAQARLIQTRMTLAENARQIESAMREQVDQLQIATATLQERLKIAQDENLQADDQLSKLRTEIEAQSAEHAARRREPSDLTIAKSDADKRCAQLKVERNALSSQRNILQAELDRQKQACDRLSRELAKHRRRQQKQKKSFLRRAAHPLRAIGKPLLRRLRRNSEAKHQKAKHSSRLSADETALRTSGLFDAGWYQASYPEAAGYRGGAVRHYLERGAAEGKDPNPFFSTTWYVRHHREAGLSGLNPLLHYVKIGAKADLKPSEAFDPGWYRATYPDVVAAGLEPLRHFLHHGKAEGRRQNARDRARSVTDARLVVLKSPKPSKQTALVVTHTPTGQIKPHVLIYLEALKLAGFSTVVIVASDRVDSTEVENLRDRVDGLLVRENGGYDFAAWAHATRHVDFTSTELLCLANDSLIGPFTPAALQNIMDRVRVSNAQLIGLTDNYEFKHHIQSYFLIGKNEGVRVLIDFLGNVYSLESKQEVIMSYELQLLDMFENRGLTGEALFPTKGSVNRTTMEWRALIEEGFPFVKASVLCSAEAAGWQNILSARGYDPAVAEASIAILGRRDERVGGQSPLSAREELLATQSAMTGALQATALERDAAASWAKALARDLAKARKRPWRQVRKKLEFRVYAYLARLSDPASTAADRYRRRASKRDPKRSLRTGPPVTPTRRDLREPSLRHEYAGRASHDPAKQNVLVVSHQASRTGAPILALNIARCLSTRYNIAILCLTGGEIIDDFCAASEKVIDANLHSMDSANYEGLIGRICRERSYAFAVVNSVESHAVLQVLHERGVPSVVLLHEFASYTPKRTAFPEAIRWASEVVFSTRLTLENAFNNNVLDLTPKIHVMPQGRCRAPVPERSPAARELERERLRDALRPEGARKRRFLVLGAGTVEIRKGVDLFLEVATRVLNDPGGEHAVFAWIGARYNPEHDFAYSVYLHDQLERANIKDRVVFLPATSEIDLAYELSDVLLLSSRLDPLPNVALDALCLGLPVVCFENTTGIADLLIDAGLRDGCVARYIDTNDLASKLLRLARSPEHYQQVSTRTRDFAQTVFDFDRYSERIEMLGQRAKSRADHAAMDVDDIVASGRFRPDFYDPSGERTTVTPQLVRDYLDRLNWLVGARKPEPGFNPFVYAELGTCCYDETKDAYADFLRKGRPAGRWLTPVIDGGPAANGNIRESSLKTGLHLHAYFSDQLCSVIDRLRLNATCPDLFVSVVDASAVDEARSVLAEYPGRVIAVREVPNVGRDIGPLLTEFGPILASEYDVVGHIHVKRSRQPIGTPISIESSSSFLFENLLGGPVGGKMVDQILSQMQKDERVGLVFADDPYILGWTRNLNMALELAQKMGHTKLPCGINFPVGSMFWMRSNVLKSFVDLNLDWVDYPAEPIADDGTILHALERLFGIIPILAGWKSAVTNIRGVTR